jgi:hypothetical protein
MHDAHVVTTHPAVLLLLLLVACILVTYRLPAAMR